MLYVTSLFLVEVLDEAHVIRSSKTKKFKAIKQIKAERKLALTGTPFVNRPEDIYSLLNFLGVQPLNDLSVFRRAITQPMKEGNEVGLSRLRATMAHVALRRSKHAAEIQLPGKEVQLRSIDFLEDINKKVYDAIFGTIRIAFMAVLQAGEQKIMKNYSSIFEKLLRLRQCCCSLSLIPPERMDTALKLWEDYQGRIERGHKLSAEEGAKLLEKLKGTFTLEDESVPECAVCLMEMNQSDCRILRACAHIFCTDCSTKLLEMSDVKCPLCRVPFTNRDMIEKEKVAIAATQDSDEASNNVSGYKSGLGRSPKILALLEALNEMKQDEKGVIFSQFTKFLDQIANALSEEGYSFVRIHGSMSVKNRMHSVESFNSESNDSPRIIICSLHAAGTGINLTRGNHVFMMDCWWNQATENQAMDRVHRIGQRRKVIVRRFVMKDSIEERIVALQEAKGLQAKGAMEKLKPDELRKARLRDLKGLLLIEEENEDS